MVGAQVSADPTSWYPAASTRLLTVAERWTQRRWWAARTTALTVVVSLVVAFPSYNDLDTSDPTWVGLRFRAAHGLFDHAGLSTSSRAYELTFRVTVPLLAKVLHLGSTAGFLAIQAAGGVALILMVALLMERITGDRVVATLVTLALASTWIGACGFCELRGNFDAVALALLMAAAYFRHPLLVLLFGVAAAWTDERCVLALVLVAIFHVVLDGPVSVRRLWRSPQVITIAGAIVVYLATRVAVSVSYDLSQPHTRLYTTDQLNNVPAGLWVAFEGLWLLIAAGWFVTIKQRHWLLLATTLLPFAAICFLAISVVDITRGFLFASPALLLAFAELRHVDRAWLRKAALWAAGVTLLWPVSYVGGKSTVFWQFPLPIQLLRFAGLAS